MEFPNTKNVPLEQIKNLLSTNRGIYFWFDVNDGSLVYIGKAVGSNGLKRRIVQQHLILNISNFVLKYTRLKILFS
jgi:hypothetical protein